MNAFQAQPWRESFSTREIEVLQLISRGASNREIAQKLHLSIETVKWYNKQMFSKLGVNNRIQAVNKAAELALLSSEQAIKSQKKPAEAGNLPAQLTSYVGREKEIKEIKELLKHNRLVMLTGVGGAGKTRLALKVGEELNGRYPDGVWMVELANLRDPSLVIQTIANVLHISKRTDPDSTLQELLSRYLRRRHLLLLIDNLEHVLECAPLIGELLAAAPQLSVIGTSRERLHLYGEQEYPVHPLNLPESLDNMTSDDLKNVESINLFIKRAQSIDPSISFDMDELKGVARICASLDGLPLAIELCAPMLKMFPPGEIADRIETSLDVIPGGPRDLPARHQTLDNTIQWSFNLLEESEKRLFERLSIFNGDATLEVIESICGGELPGNIVDLLSALVNKNLVLAQERQDGEIYFRLLETVRQFSYQKLLLSNQAERFAKRHAKTFMKLAQKASVELRGANQIFWTGRLIIMRENFRTALAWMVDSGDTESALRFTNAQFEFWLRYPDFEEARQWLEKVLALPGAQNSLEPFSKNLNSLAWIYFLLGKHEEARKRAEHALSLARSQPNTITLVVVLINLGLIIFLQDQDVLNSRALIEEARDLSLEIQAEWEHARSHMALAVVLSRQGKYTEAHSSYEKAFNKFQKLGDLNFQCVVKRLMGELEIERNHLAEGIEAFRDSLKIARVVKNNLQIAYNLLWLARAEKQKGNHVRAFLFYLGSKKVSDTIGTWYEENVLELEESQTIVRELLGDEEFNSTLKAAQKMTVEEAIEFAFGDRLQLNSES